MKTAADCQHKAVYYKSCECGEKGTETFETGSYAAHIFGAWISEVAATETANGTKGHKDCSVCSKHFDANGVEITDLVIAKKSNPSPKPNPVKPGGNEDDKNSTLITVIIIVMVVVVLGVGAVITVYAVKGKKPTEAEESASEEKKTEEPTEEESSEEVVEAAEEPATEEAPAEEASEDAKPDEEEKLDDKE